MDDNKTDRVTINIIKCVLATMLGYSFAKQKK